MKSYLTLLLGALVVTEACSQAPVAPLPVHAFGAPAQSLSDQVDAETVILNADLLLDAVLSDPSVRRFRESNEGAQVLVHPPRNEASCSLLFSAADATRVMKYDAAHPPKPDQVRIELSISPSGDPSAQHTTTRATVSAFVDGGTYRTSWRYDAGWNGHAWEVWIVELGAIYL